MKLAQITKYAAIGTVAGIAAYASYTHMRELALVHGQTHTVAALLPVSVDGMLIVATLVMREDRSRGIGVRPWAWIAFLLGVTASIVANVLAAASDITSRVISAWPALALLLVIEVLATGKKAAELPPAEPATVATSALMAGLVQADTMSDIVSDIVSDTTRPARVRKRPSTAERVAKLRDRQPDLGVSAMAQKLGVSERTVTRHLAGLVNGAEVPDMVTVN